MSNYFDISGLHEFGQKLKKKKDPMTCEWLIYDIPCLVGLKGPVGVHGEGHGHHGDRAFGHRFPDRLLGNVANAGVDRRESYNHAAPYTV